MYRVQTLNRIQEVFEVSFKYPFVTPLSQFRGRFEYSQTCFNPHHALSTTTSGLKVPDLIQEHTLYGGVKDVCEFSILPPNSDSGLAK